LVHALGGPVEYVVPTAVAGVILCLVFWQTATLLPCIAIHCAVNTIEFGVHEGWNPFPTIAMLAVVVAAALIPALIATAPAKRPLAWDTPG
jgi:membrane protease YdiL (CAAX protease family)